MFSFLKLEENTISFVPSSYIWSGDRDTLIIKRKCVIQYRASLVRDCITLTEQYAVFPAHQNLDYIHIGTGKNHY